MSLNSRNTRRYLFPTQPHQLRRYRQSTHTNISHVKQPVTSSFWQMILFMQDRITYTRRRLINHIKRLTPTHTHRGERRYQTWSMHRHHFVRTCWFSEILTLILPYKNKYLVLPSPPTSTNMPDESRTKQTTIFERENEMTSHTYLTWNVHKNWKIICSDQTEVLQEIVTDRIQILKPCDKESIPKENTYQRSDCVADMWMMSRTRFRFIAKEVFTYEESDLVYWCIIINI